SRATCRPEKPSTVALNCLTETMWARRCRPRMSPEKGRIWHSKFAGTMKGFLWNGDYDEGPYDDDMYEGHDLLQEIQAICDNLDIRV
nr:hypothetical protein [Tanacetum cinerariifolium]